MTPPDTVATNGKRVCEAVRVWSSAALPVVDGLAGTATAHAPAVVTLVCGGARGRVVTVTSSAPGRYSLHDCPTASVTNCDLTAAFRDRPTSRRSRITRIRSRAYRST